MSPVPLAHAARVVLGRQRSPGNHDGPNMVPYLRSANITDGALDLSDVKTMNFSLSEQARFSLQAGDVLVTEGSGSRDSVGASAVWRGEVGGVVCFQNTLLRLRPRDQVCDGRYLGWWARHAHATGMMAAASTGANILHLGAENLRRLPIDLPPLEEQRRIADFLDDQTTRINHTIKLRQRQVELLAEHEYAEHVRIVAGQDHSGVRKDSGLPWLGSIPSAWAVATVGSQFEVALGKMLNEERSLGKRQMPYLRNTNVQWYQVLTDDLKTMSYAPAEVGRYGIRSGDLLVCEGGQPGRAAIYEGADKALFFQKALHRVRPRTDASAGWLLCCLRVAAEMSVFTVSAGQTTIGHLTNEQLRRQRFPFPNKEQQENRYRHLRQLVISGEKFRQALKLSIEVMQERKRTLITAAVTGEFDVASASSRATWDVGTSELTPPTEESEPQSMESPETTMARPRLHRPTSLSASTFQS